MSRWPLVRLLAASRAFRLVVLLFVLGAVATPLMLLKIWRVSSAGQARVTRISTVDYLQAWSLKRKARAAAERGDSQNAFLAWRAAAANNPSDLDALRGGLGAIQRSSTPAEQASSALSMGAWLLRTGETNLADAELVSTVWNRCELHDRTATALAGITNVTSTTLNIQRAIAFFRSGRVSSLQSLLQTNPELAARLDQAATAEATLASLTPVELELRAVALAYRAGWGASEVRNAAVRELENMAQYPPAETLTQELLMAVFLQTRDAFQCEQIFRGLQANGRAGIRHVSSYCTLLALEGRKEEAKRVIREFNPSPSTDSDVLRLVAVYRLLEMAEEADALAEAYLSNPPWLEQGAVLRAEFLEHLLRWDALRRLAFRVRSFPVVMESLGGFSHYLEGLAEWNEGYRDNAEVAFRRAAELGFPDPRVGLKVAEGLLRLDQARFAGYAEQILLSDRLKSELANDTGYLRRLVQCADALKRSEYLWNVVTNLYTLAPNDSVAVNNYAAALLLFRRKPEEAIVHTLRLLQAYPNQTEVVLNHAIALTLNRRLEEAEATLARIIPEKLTSDAVRTQYYLAMFELYLLQDRKAEARQVLRLIDVAHLFPVQTQWLQEHVTGLEAVPTAPN